MEKLKITIEVTGGRWLVNGKSLYECSEMEKEILNSFFKEFKRSKNGNEILNNMINDI